MYIWRDGGRGGVYWKHKGRKLPEYINQMGIVQSIYVGTKVNEMAQ